MPEIAKLSRPKLHDVLLRDRLFDRIDAARTRHSVIWISGPPGAGKTALTASYVAHSKLDTTWYQLDRGDGDCATFFYYLARAFGRRAARGRGMLPFLTPEYLADVPRYTRHFFRQFFDHIRRPGAWVLDNYQELDADSALHRVIVEAIEEMPEGIHLYVASRTDPPEAFSRLAASGSVFRLDWDELRFTPEETRQVAAGGPASDDRVIATLHRLSGGWAAGLTLALQGLKGSGPAPENRAQIAREAIFSYFSSQVFEVASPDVRRFLTLTALIPATTAEMAEALTGSPRAAAYLEDMYRRRLFTDRRGSRPPVYQYHDLFRDFLLQRLSTDQDPAVLATFRHSAGTLLEAAGEFDEAFKLYAAAGAVDAMMRLTLFEAPALLAQGRGHALRDRIALVPNAAVEAQPWLSFWLGMSYVWAAPDEARRPLEIAFERFRAAGDTLGQLLACSGILSACCFEYATFVPMDRWIEEQLRMLRDAPAFPSAAIELQVVGPLVFAMNYRRPDASALARLSSRVESLLSDEGIPINDRIWFAMFLLHHLLEALKPGDCRRLRQLVDPLVKRSDVSPLNDSLWKMQVGWHLWYEHDLDGAERAFTESLDICARHAISLPTANAYSLFGLALLAVESGALARAESLRLKAMAFADTTRQVDGAWYQFVKSRIARGRDDFADAAVCAARMLDIARAAGSHHYVRIASLELAHSRIEESMHGDADDILAGARALVADTAYDAYVADIEFMSAFNSWRRDPNDSEWKGRFVDAVLRIKTDDCRLCLREHDHRIMPELVAAAFEAGLERDFLSVLVQRFDIPPPARHVGDWPWPVKIFTLGRFEILVYGISPKFARKAPTRSLQVLKLLIAMGGTGVASRRIIGTLWPDESGENGQAAFSVALSRLRRLLGGHENIELFDGRLSLNAERVWVDSLAFERTAIAAKSGDATASERHAEEAMRLYEGAFLPADADESWSHSAREKLRHRFLALVSAVAGAHERNGDFAKALQLYRSGIDADDLAEALYRGAMRCHAALGSRAEALGMYRRLRQTLSVTLGIAPSAETLRIFESLRD